MAWASQCRGRTCRVMKKRSRLLTEQILAESCRNAKSPRLPREGGRCQVRWTLRNLSSATGDFVRRQMTTPVRVDPDLPAGSERVPHCGHLRDVVRSGLTALRELDLGGAAAGREHDLPRPFRSHDGHGDVRRDWWSRTGSGRPSQADSRALASQRADSRGPYSGNGEFVVEDIAERRRGQVPRRRLWSGS
jgi:hypothetical protein